MFISHFKKIPFKGKIEVVDSTGNVHTFGQSYPYVRIKLKNKSIERKIFSNPSLHIGEGYMDEEIIIEEGTIETFIQIICASYSNIIKNSFFQKYLNYFSTVFRSFQQLNNILVSKKNVAHHYDLNEELYRLFLDEDMQYSC